MKTSRLTLSSAFFVAAVSVLPGHGQVVKTTGFGTGAITTVGNQITIPANAGQQMGSNLFHSFNQFDVGTGVTATFTPTGSTSAISNIIARIYSATPSMINGSVVVDPTGNFSAANLFLINPNGVIFGNGASVSVPGDFVVSTSNYVNFMDGSVFYSDPGNASNSSSDPTFGITAAPLTSFGFFKGTTSASIMVNGATLAAAGSLQFVGGDFMASSGSAFSSGNSATLTNSTLSVFSGHGVNVMNDATVPYLTGAGASYPAVTHFDTYGAVTLGDMSGGATLAAKGTGGALVIRGGKLVQQGAGGTMTASSSIAIHGDSLAVGTMLAPGGTISTTTGTIGIDTDGDITMMGGTISSTSGAITLGKTALVNLTLDSTSIIKQTTGSGGLFTINSTGIINNSGSISTKGSTNAIKINAVALNLAAGGSITASGGSVMLGTSADPLGSFSSVTGTTISNTGAGTLTINTTGAVDHSGTISTANGALSIDTMGALTLTGGAITSTGAITIGQTNLGSLSLDTTSSISATASGTVAITSTGAIANSGMISTATGALKVDTTGALNLTGGSITSTGAITLGQNHLGSLSLDNASSIAATSNGTVIINSTGLISNSGMISTANGALKIDTTGALNLTGGSIASTGAITLGQNHLASLSLDSTSSIAATSNGTVAITSAGAIGDSGTISTASGALNIDTMGAMTLTGGTITSGGGTITLGQTNLGDLSLDATSLINAVGGTVNVTSNGNIMLTGGSIESTNIGTGNAGPVNLTDTVGTLTLSAGGQIASIATGSGNAGNVTLNNNASATTGVQTITITGTGVATPNSGIFSLSSGTGNAGSVNVTAIGNVVLSAGGQIATIASNANGGTAGSVTLNVLGFSTLTAGGISANATTPVPIIYSSTGNPLKSDGNISVNDELSSIELQPGAAIQTSSQDAKAGDINLQASALTLDADSAIQSLMRQTDPNDSAKTGSTGNVYVLVLNPFSFNFATFSFAGPLSIADGALIQTVANPNTTGFNPVGQVTVFAGSLMEGSANVPYKSDGFNYAYQIKNHTNIRMLNSASTGSPNGQDAGKTGTGTPQVSNLFGFPNNGSDGTVPTPPAGDGIILDGSLGSGSIIPQLMGSTYVYMIPSTDGTTVGGKNLFLSFLEFDLGVNHPDPSNSAITGQVSEEALFDAVGYSNIIVRVTNGQASQIDGKLAETTGTNANLFFLNPNGVMFTTNAFLNLNGAFIVSTANAIEFGTGPNVATFLTQKNPAADSLLASEPSFYSGNVTGFVFAPGTPQPVSFDSADLSNNNAAPLNSQIQVIAGNITLSDGALLNSTSTLLFSAASGGTLTFDTQNKSSLGALPPVLTSASQLLTETGFSALGAIAITGNSAVTVPSPNVASTIIMRGGSFALTDSLVVDQTTAQAGSAAGKVLIDVTGDVNIMSQQNSSFISTSTLGSVNGGSVQINAANLNITGDPNDIFTAGILSTAQPANYYSSDPDGSGSNYYTFTYTSPNTARGTAGAINLNVSGQIQLSDFAQISADTTGLGNAGTITIGGLNSSNPQLMLSNGSSITSSTFVGNPLNFPTTGDGGQIHMTLSSLSITGQAPVGNPNGSLIAASAGTSLVPTNGTSRGGNVVINVIGQTVGGNGDITISDGGQISASSFNNGSGGTVEVEQSNAADGITINGSGSTLPTGIAAAEFSTGSAASAALILSTSSPLLLEAGGEITTSAGGNGNAGTVEITSGNLTIDGAGADPSQATGILSSSTGLGASGTMVNGSALGNGGSIVLGVTGDAVINTGGVISASSATVGQAGTVEITQSGSTDITDPTLSPATNGGIFVNGGTISTAATGIGAAGGNALAGAITLNTQALTVNGGTITSNTLGLSNAGNITVNGDNPSLMTPAPPTQFVDVHHAGKISSNTGGAGDGGAIAINATLLTMNGNGSTISTNAVAGTGDGGSVTVTAPTVTVETGATISSGTSSMGDGGTLIIGAGSLLVDGTGSAISTSATGGTGGGGAILITVTGNPGVAGSTGDVVLTNGGAISAFSGTTGSAGTIKVTQSGSTDLTDPTKNPATNGGLYINNGQISTAASGVGSTMLDAGAGNLTLNVEALTMTNNAVVLSSTKGLSKAGDVTIGGSVMGQPTQFIVLQDGASIASETSGAPMVGTGAGGTVLIGTQSLLVDNAAISTNATGGKGNAGDIVITASSSDPTAMPSVMVQDGATIMSESEATGSAGMITIAANTTTVTDAGSAITTDAGSQGTAGNSKGEIMLSGQKLIVKDSGVVSATTGGLSPGGTITALEANSVALTTKGELDASSTAASGGGNGGSIQIGSNPVGSPDDFGMNSPFTVSLALGSVISCDSQDTNGGNIEIHAQAVTIDSGSLVSTSEPNGAATTLGGDITINAGQVFYLNDESFILSNSGQGTGGNILIDPEFTVLNHSGISAAGGLMNGNVTIDSTYVFSGTSFITATGTVEIDSVPLDLNGSLIALPANLTSEEKRLREKCARAVNHEFSSLIVVGRGGTESGPEEFQPDFGEGSDSTPLPAAQKNLR